MSAKPSSVRFDPDVLGRLNAYVKAHPGTSLSSAGNLLVDEALRSHDHPMIVFRDGPSGRRARLVGGPDVWEVIRAVRSTRSAEPGLTADEVVELVADNAGLGVEMVREALAYWAEYSDEIDAFIERADSETARARERWSRQHDPLSE